MLYHLHIAELPNTRTGATCQVRAYVTSPDFDYDSSQVMEAFEFPTQLLEPVNTEDALRILGLFCGSAAQAEPFASHHSPDAIGLHEWLMWFYSDTNTRIQITLTQADDQVNMAHLFDLPESAVVLAEQAQAWLARIKLGWMAQNHGLDKTVQPEAEARARL